MANWHDPVTCLKGIGQKKAEQLARLNIHTVKDLLHHFPFRYQDISVKHVSELEDGQMASVMGLVMSPPVVHYFRSGKGSRLTFTIKLEQAMLRINFFNQPYFKKQIHLGEPVIIYGRYDASRQQLAAQRLIKMDASGEVDQTEGVYRTTQGLSQKDFKRWMKLAWEKYHSCIEEVLPPALVDYYHLPSHHEALYAMHFPKDIEASQQARWQIKYQEFFLYQWQLIQLKRTRYQQEAGLAVSYPNHALQAFIKTLPYELTPGQKEVTNLICRDLRAPYPMRRLLQGDVGSGKTIVALLACLAVALTGQQSVFMAPTEILAEQHYLEAQERLGQQLSLALLTGGLPAKKRRELLKKLAAGEIDLLLGTHALLEEDVQFKALALAIIDEQHRFGVKQRQALEEKNKAARINVLAMSATPIPRTLELTLYGDMDVARLRDMPRGRKPIITEWVRPLQEEQVNQKLKAELALGHQAYIICPLIENSETEAAENAEEIYLAYQKRLVPRYRVGLLHGQLKAEEKEAVMAAFKERQIDVLVATTVIEVGVDVPNANLMIILSAERFGLAQLHQLRGRVGRGQTQAYCLLVAEPRTEVGEERLRIMTESADGFYLSEADLALRGSGDLLGTKQSGLPEFHAADPIADRDILQAAHRDATYVAWQFAAEPERFPRLQALEKRRRIYDKNSH